jgi:hypothetical protein
MPKVTGSSPSETVLYKFPKLLICYLLQPSWKKSQPTLTRSLHRSSFLCQVVFQPSFFASKARSVDSLLVHFPRYVQFALWLIAWVPNTQHVQHFAGLLLGVLGLQGKLAEVKQ